MDPNALDVTMPRLGKRNSFVSASHKVLGLGDTNIQPFKAPNSILDIDPSELANQFTLMSSRLFCAIHPRELIGQEFSKKIGSLAVNVKAMSALSTQITTWVAESILFEE